MNEITPAMRNCMNRPKTMQAPVGHDWPHKVKGELRFESNCIRCLEGFSAPSDHIRAGLCFRCVSEPSPSIIAARKLAESIFAHNERPQEQAILAPADGLAGVLVPEIGREAPGGQESAVAVNLRDRPSINRFPDGQKSLLDVMIPCILPTCTAQHKGVRIIKAKGKLMPMFYKKKELLAAEAQLKRIFLPHVPSKPFKGALKVEAQMLYAWRKSETKKVRAQYSETPIETGSDADNLWKLMGDVLTDMGFWSNDSQIADLRLQKRYSDTPGVWLTISRALPTIR